jgi:hypothetical protein
LDQAGDCATFIFLPLPLRQPPRELTCVNTGAAGLPYRGQRILWGRERDYADHVQTGRNCGDVDPNTASDGGADDPPSGISD